MKLARLLSCSFVLFTLASCQTGTSDVGYVKQVFLHSYGVAVSKADWNSRGKNGKIISTRRDGVTETKQYDEGILNGETTYTFPHSQIIEKKETYTHGELTATAWNYPSGTPKKAIEQLKNGKLKKSTWYETGTPKSIEKLIGNKILVGQYYTPENDLEGMVQQGTGERPVRDRFGQLVAMETVEEGELRLKTEYHPNGTPKAISEFSEGKVHGTRKTFLPSGEPEAIETWENGVQEGETTAFRNGSKFATIPYAKGLKNGVEKRYAFATGDVVETISWKNGFRHGPREHIVEKEKNISWFYHDKPVSKWTYEKMVNSTTR